MKLLLQMLISATLLLLWIVRLPKLSARGTRMQGRVKWNDH
jgi:hypothetical protein